MAAPGESTQVRNLHVGIPSSVHLARWIRLPEDQGWDQHLFGVNEHPPSVELRSVTLHSLAVDPHSDTHPSVRVSRLQDWIEGPTRPELAAYTLGIGQAGVLTRLIRQLRTDVIHSHEFQHGAYLTLEARSRLNQRFPTWIAANWSSDIIWFSREPKHQAAIERVLAACDYYNAECHRDVGLARKLGLLGPFRRIPENLAAWRHHVTSTTVAQSESPRRASTSMWCSSFSPATISPAKCAPWRR